MLKSIDDFIREFGNRLRNTAYGYEDLPGTWKTCRRVYTGNISVETAVRMAEQLLLEEETKDKAM